jgi:hypothetical protein
MGIYKKGDNYYIDYYVKGKRKREKIGTKYNFQIMSSIIHFDVGEDFDVFDILF